MSSFGHPHEAVNIKLPQDVAMSFWWFNVRQKGNESLELVNADRVLAPLVIRLQISCYSPTRTVARRGVVLAMTLSLDHRLRRSRSTTHLGTGMCMALGSGILLNRSSLAPRDGFCAMEAGWKPEAPVMAASAARAQYGAPPRMPVHISSGGTRCALFTPWRIASLDLLARDFVQHSLPKVQYIPLITPN